jgi:FixJ family two-component response regulator
MQAGADGYVTKPVSKPELLDAVDRALKSIAALDETQEAVAAPVQIQQTVLV